MCILRNLCTLFLQRVSIDHTSFVYKETCSKASLYSRAVASNFSGISSQCYYVWGRGGGGGYWLHVYVTLNGEISSFPLWAVCVMWNWTLSCQCDDKLEWRNSVLWIHLKTLWICQQFTFGRGENVAIWHFFPRIHCFLYQYTMTHKAWKTLQLCYWILLYYLWTTSDIYATVCGDWTVHAQCKPNAFYVEKLWK